MSHESKFVPTETKEGWRKVPGFKRYSMSTSDEVRNDNSMRLIADGSSGARKHFQLISDEDGKYRSLTPEKLKVLVYPEITSSAEDWKDINGHSKYEVSSSGSIRRADTRGLLKPQDPGNGYLRVTLTKDESLEEEEKTAYRYVHILVLSVFGPPKPSPVHTVNHKNGIVSDNRISNLEWATDSEQQKHAVATGLKKPQSNERKVTQIQLDGTFVAYFQNAYVAARSTGADQRKIHAVCKEERKTHYGFRWEYSEELLEEPWELPGEEWRTCVKAPNYEVSSLGRVRNATKIMAQAANPYKHLSLVVDSKSQSLLTHILVAYTFLINDDPGRKTQVHHIDENKINNHVDNLMWCTPQDNIIYSFGCPVTILNKTTKLPVEIFFSMSLTVEEMSCSNGEIYRAIESGKEFKGHILRRYIDGDEDVFIK